MYQEYSQFPCDTEEAYGALWRTHLGWLASVLYATAAAKASGIAVSKATEERWFRFGAYAYLLDQLIDEQPEDRKAEARAVYEQLILSNYTVPEWVDPDLVHVARLFDDALESWTPQKRAMALGFLTHAERKASHRNAWRYGAEVAREGRLMGNLMAACMTDAESQGWRFGRFRRWFGNFAAGGALLDTLRDLGRDHAANRTSVRPTRINCLIVAGWCLVVSAKLWLHPKICRSVFMVFPDFWGMPYRSRPLDELPKERWQERMRLAEDALHV